MAAGFLIFIGVLILWGGNVLFRKANRIKTWDSVTATFIKKGARISTTASGGGPGSRHELDLIYSYSHKGKEYQGTKYSFVTTLASEEETLAKADKLPPSTTAYVNPSNPEETFIVAPPMWLPYLTLGFGAICVLSGGVLFLVSV